MERIETLYTSVGASNVLDMYMIDIIFKDSYKLNNLLQPQINKPLKISLLKYLILSMKEDIILKPKNDTYKNTLLFSEINSLVGPIAEIAEDGKVDVGGYVFEDANHLVAFIRNKFAHGDYVYSDDFDCVIFNFDGNYIPISTESLEEFALNLFNKKYEYKITDEHVNPLLVANGQRKKNHMGYATDAVMKELLDLYTEYVFDLSSSNGNIPKDAFICFDTAKERLRKTSDYYRDSSQETVIKKMDMEVASFVDYYNEKSKKEGWDVTLTYKRVDLTDETKYSVIDTFKKIKGGKANYYDVVNELPIYASRTLNNEYNKTVGMKRCAEFLVCLDVMLKCSNSDIKTIGEYVSSKLNTAILIDQDIYAMVQVLRLLDFSYMFENFDIEYNLLPLDILQPKVCKFVDNKYDEAVKLSDSYEKKAQSARNTILSLVEQIEKVSSNDDMPKERKSKALAALNKKLDDAHTRYIELSNISIDKKIKVSDLLKDRDDNKEYYYNRYILERIRDSISHGNVYIIPNGEILDTIVRFEDNYNGELIFSLDIQLRNLIILLDECTGMLSKQEIKMRKK